MIISKDFKIKIPEEFTSGYIEKELKKMGLDVLRWAVTGYDEEFYTVTASYVKE